MNQQAQQHQQQQQKKDAPAFKADKNTIWFVLTDQEFETRARREIQQQHGGAGQLRTVVNTLSLAPHHTIVCVYYDQDAEVPDEHNPGKTRPRKRATKDPATKLRIAGEAPAVQFGQPVALEALWYEGTGENDAMMQILNLRDEDGRVRLGLIGKLVDSCMKRDVYGRKNAVVQVQHRADNHELILRQA